MKIKDKLSRFLRLAARYTDNPRALKVKMAGGIPETFCKLDEPWFYTLGIKSVIDVGANEGQFSTTMRRILAEAEIFAFEPIPECYNRVKKRFADDPRFHLYNTALGDKEDTLKLTVSEVTGASSLLPMSDLQAKHFPESLVHRKVDVSVKLLDEVLANQSLVSPYILKIDVQGYEYPVLMGGKKTLEGASLVIVEASFEAFYDGQKLFKDIYQLLSSYGFKLIDSFGLMHDPETGRALQGDFLFVKTK